MTILTTIVSKLAALVAAIVMLFGLTHASALVAATPSSATTTTTTSTTTTVSPLGVGAVTSQTDWRGFTPNGWAVSFSAESDWALTASNDATTGNPSYVSLTGATTAVVISKDLHIAAPGTISPSVTTKIIDGQSVQVSRYDNPQAGYAYDLSFVLPIDGSQYYFLLQSATTSTATADNFISLIKS